MNFKIPAMAIVLIALAAILWFAREGLGSSEPFSHVAHSGASDSAPRKPTSIKPAQTTRGSDHSAAQKMSDESPAVSLADRLESSHDYWAFGNELMIQSNAGDAQAQYYLYRVLEYCRDRAGFFLTKGSRVLALDEAQEYAARRSIPQEFVQLAFDRCHDFLSHDSSVLGTEDHWLSLAAKSGVPEAQADAALKLITYEAMKDIAKERGEPVPGYERRLPLDVTPESLLREAIKTRSPHVLARISDALPVIGRDTAELDTERYALLLLACERGYDCSSNAEWVQASCSFNQHCAGYSDPTQRVMEASGANWPAVQQRAAELGEKIDAGAWDDLGLTSEALED
jgi:hypothetical protein